MTKLRYIFCHFYNSENLFVLIFHAETQPKISSGSGGEVDFGVLLFLETEAILDIRPDHILQL